MFSRKNKNSKAGANKRAGGGGFKALGRGIRYLGHYRRETILAYTFLFISTAAQLMVPQMVQNILDAVTNGMVAKQLAGAGREAQGISHRVDLAEVDLRHIGSDHQLG